VNNKKWWIKVVIAGFCFIFVFLVQRQNFLIPDFIDEQDNFIVAKNIIDGNKIYTNVFSHHQPGPYILSALIQVTTKPDLIQNLVLRHRQFVFVWSIVWILLIMWRFGYQMLVPLMIVEIVKNKYLGSLFLAESLVVAPMIYLVLSYLENNVYKYEQIFLGIIIGIVGICLAPMWPLLGLLAFIYCWRWKNI